MEIANPRRILAVSLADSAQHLSDVIRDLTGTHPTPAPPQPDLDPDSASGTGPEEEKDQETQETLAGTTHPLRLATPYYTASVPVWLDLLASPADWSASFLSPEAREVLDVLGGVLVVFALPSVSPPSSSLPALVSDAASPPPPAVSASGEAVASPGQGARERARELITHVGKVVREGLGGWEWEGVGLAVGVGGASSAGAGDGDGAELDEWEDLCAEWGLEFVHVPRADLQAGKGKEGEGEKGKRNEFGERMGMARVLEALQANDWSGGGMGGGDGEEGEGDGTGGEGKGLQDDDDDDDDGEFDPSKLDFGFDREDFAGLRQAIWTNLAEDEGEGSKQPADEDEEIGDQDVQKLERMMTKLLAVRDASAGLPEEQRKRMAARAVGEVMKEL